MSWPVILGRVIGTTIAFFVIAWFGNEAITYWHIGKTYWACFFLTMFITGCANTTVKVVKE